MTVTFSLQALIDAPTRPTHLFMLHFLEQAGVELRCWSTLPRSATKLVLAHSGWLPYFDDILWQRPANGVIVDNPKKASYTALSRVVPLPRKPLLAFLDNRLTRRLYSSSASTIHPEANP